MIRLKAFLSILFLLFILNPIQAQTWQKYRKSGNSNLTDVVFVSKSRGFIIGYQKVFMTTDTGKTWNQILSSYSDFSRIMFADATNGFIIGSNDLVLKTTDAGNNWSLIRTGNSDDDLITLCSANEKNLSFKSFPTTDGGQEIGTLTVNGKLDRAALPEPNFVSVDSYVAPRDELERAVCKIWSEVLGLAEDSVGIRDNFFRLGGDSIISIQQ